MSFPDGESKVALVLGGTGVVGSAACERLRRDGWKVTATGRKRGEMVLDVAEPHDHDPFLQRVTDLRPALVIDAIGRFRATPLDGPHGEVQSLWYANAFGRAGLLHRMVPVLPTATAIIRVESSLGDFPLLSAPVASAAKAADRVLSLALLRRSGRAGLFFGSIVLTAVAESLTPREISRYADRFGHPPPSAEAVADAIADLVPIVRRSPAGTRLLFPAHGFAVDPMTETDMEG